MTLVEALVGVTVELADIPGTDGVSRCSMADAGRTGLEVEDSYLG